MAISTALSSAVSGMTSEQTALDATANNIANVNTPGYKSQTVSFSDMLSQTIGNATAATATTGSTNPRQIGMGAQVASTDTNLSVGSTTSSSTSTNVALTGQGQLVVQTSDGSLAYTRDGNVKVDENGNLNINGYEVCGWEDYTLDADGKKVYKTTGSVEPINVYTDSYSGSKKVMAAKETTAATLSGNLDSEASVTSGATFTNIGSATVKTPTTSTTINVYDSQGNEVPVTVDFTKCATENSITSWYWTASAKDATISPASGYIAFDADGKLVTSTTTLEPTVTSSTSSSGYTSSDITASGVSSGTYTYTVSGDAVSGYTYTLTNGTNSYTGTASGSTVSFTVGSGTVNVTNPSTVSAGSTKFSVDSSSNVTVAATGYSDSNVTVATGVDTGSYSVNVASGITTGTYTITLTGPDGKTYTTTSTDGSATFKTSSGTVTLSAPSSVSTGTTTFNVATGSTYNFDPSSLTMTVTSTTNATGAVPVTVDFSKLTSTGTTSSVACKEDGYAAGTATGDYTISSDGTISISYTNDQTQTVGQIALAMFDNAGGLSKEGDNLYKPTIASGDVRYVVAGEDGSGEMKGYELELSNVDLATQFSNMMIYQRAYQANSKVITTSDTMLDSLINMVR